MKNIASSLTRLIYSSRPIAFDQEKVKDILRTARECNERDRITGALICRDDIYLQLLEGAAQAVDRTYRRIVEDPRHNSITLLLYERVAERMFPDWTMRNDPIRLWMWSPSEVAAGDVERAPKRDLLKAFERISAEQTGN